MKKIFKLVSNVIMLMPSICELLQIPPDCVTVAVTAVHIAIIILTLGKLIRKR